MELTLRNRNDKTTNTPIDNGWVTVTIDDLFEFSGGSQPPRSTFVFQMKEGYTRLLQIRDYKTDKYTTYIPSELVKKSCNKDDIMIGRYGPPIFQILRGLEGAYNVALIKATPKTIILKELGWYILNQEVLFTFVDKLSQRSSGQTGVDLQELKNYPVTIPKDFVEQTAIAQALSDADALIHSLEKLIEKKKKIKQGVMQELLRPKEGWLTRKLGNCAILKARIGWQGLTTAEYRESGNYYLITGTEFKNGFVDWASCHYVDEERYRQDKYIQIRMNDILVTKDGTIGKIAFVKNIPGPATLNSGVFVIRPVDNAFHPEFLYYLLLSKYFTSFLSQLTAGSTINHLYQKDFVTFQFSVPKTIEDQKSVSNLISDIDNEISALESKLTKCVKIKQGMMQNLLTGRVRLV